MPRRIETVLLVDDDADVRMLAELALESVGGWRAVLAASGDEGVAIAREERPDVIILDVVMPEMDGPATLRALRACPDTAEIPVVFCTARSGKDDVDALVAMGACGVIEKPFDPMALSAELERILAD